MTFKRVFPREGTQIPEHARPPGSINAQLHELPAFREYVHDLIGVPLYFPRTKIVMVPSRLTSGGGSDCIVTIGNEMYPRGGYNLFVPRWELQRAERIHLTVTTGRDMATRTATEMRPVMGGHRVLVEVEPVVDIPREVDGPTQSDPVELFTALPKLEPEPMAETCRFLWASYGNEHQGEGFRDHCCILEPRGHSNNVLASSDRIHVCSCEMRYDPDNPPKVPGYDKPGRHGRGEHPGGIEFSA